MQCQQANELFSDYVERRLDPALTVSVDNHLAACVACREDVAGLRRMWTQLDQMPQVAPPSTLHAAILGALDAQPTPQAQIPARPSFATALNLRALFAPRGLAYAAALLVLALGSLEVVHSQRAALDPLAALLRIIHPAAEPNPSALPAFRVTHCEWMPAPSPSALHMQIKATVPVGVHWPASLPYRAELAQGSVSELTAHPAPALAGIDWRFDASGDTTVALPLSAEQAQSGKPLALIVTLRGTAQNPGLDGQRIVIPLKIDDAIGHGNNK